MSRVSSTISWGIDMRIPTEIVAGFSYIIGLGVGIFLAKRHYKDKAQTDIKAVIDEFNVENNKLPDAETFKIQAEAMKRGVEIIVDETTGGGVSDELLSTYKSMVKEYGERRKEGKEPMSPLEIDGFITEDQFNNEEPDYDKFSLEYYPASGVLLDSSDGSVIEDPNDVIDAKILTLFGTDSLEDPDCAYFRNDSRRVDFEIVSALGDGR